MPPDRASPRSIQDTPPAGGTPQILCAFRSSASRQELSSVLAASGYATATASSLLEVLAAVAEESPELVLLDGQLGDDEIELLHAVRRSAAPGAKIATVLFPATAPSDRLDETARVLGIRLFWGRKLSPRNLQMLVEDALAGQGAPSEGELLSLCERTRADNPFVALGVPRNSQPTEIRRAYERLCSSLQRGVSNVGSPELERVAQRAFADLKTAYSKLSDPESLAAYGHKPDRETGQQRTARKETAEPNRDSAEAFRTGRAALERRDWRAALKAFRRAVELDPQDGSHRAFLGWALYLVYGAEPKALRAAIGHAKRGLQLAPGHFRPALILGKLYQFTNRLDLAERALKRAVQLEPDCIEAVRELRTLRTRRPHAKELFARTFRSWLPPSLLGSQRRAGRRRRT